MKQLTRMIAALCLFVTLLVLRELPAQIPAYYDFAGNVTRYGSKYELLILPVVLLLLSFGSRFLLLHFHRKAEQAERDKERQAAEANAKVLGIVSTAFSPKGYGMLLLAVYTMAAIVISIVRAWQVYREEKEKERDRG